MSLDLSMETGQDVPADVVEFAREFGIERNLFQVVELTQRIFPGPRRIEISVEDDPEIQEREIVFDVVVSLSAQQAVAAWEQWHRDLSDCDSPACGFCLRLDQTS